MNLEKPIRRLLNHPGQLLREPGLNLSKEIREVTYLSNSHLQKLDTRVKGKEGLWRIVRVLLRAILLMAVLLPSRTNHISKTGSGGFDR